MTAPTPSASPPPAAPVLEDRRPGPGRFVGFILLFLMVAAGLAVFSAFPWVATPSDVALLKVAFKHVAAPVETSATLSREQLEKLPRHMRPPSGQTGASGTRRDTTVRVTLDGRAILEKTYRPSGLRHDGPTFVYEELTVPLGRHALKATLAERGESGDDDAHAEGAHRRRLSADVDAKSRQVLLLELSDRRELTLR